MVYRRFKFIITIIESVHSLHFIQQEFHGFCLFDQLGEKDYFCTLRNKYKICKNYENKRRRRSDKTSVSIFTNSKLLIVSAM